MAIKYIFAGMTIQRPGYYGDPRDLSPDNVTLKYQDLICDDETARIMTAMLFSTNTILRMYTYWRPKNVRQMEDMYDFVIKYNPKSRWRRRE